MATLDLDARREEAGGGPKKVKLGGVTYDLPAEFPLQAGEHLANAEMTAAVGLLFGEENARTVMTLLSSKDLDAIAEELYDLGAGEGGAVMRPTAANRAARRATNGRKSTPLRSARS